MPTGNIIIPTLCPVNFVDRNRALLPGHNFKHFDSWLSYEQKLQYEEGPIIFQPWELSDIINLQLQADWDPIFVKMFNEDGFEVVNQQMSLAATAAGKHYLQNSTALDDPALGLTEGYYRMELHCGSPVALIMESEWMHLKTKHEDSLLAKYSNSFNNEVLWQTGIYFNFRFNGKITEFSPGSSRTIYTDQPNNTQTVKGRGFRNFKLLVGHTIGIPPWMVDTLEEILSQTSKEFDGKGFSVPDGAKFTETKVENYAWRSWEIDLRESVNRRAKLFTVSGLQEKKVAMTAVVEGALFGPIGSNITNNNDYTITELG